MKFKSLSLAAMSVYLLAGCSEKGDTVMNEDKVVEEVKTPVVVDERMSVVEYVDYFSDGLKEIQKREDNIKEAFTNLETQEDVTGDEFLDEVEKQYLAMKPVYDDFIAKSDDVPKEAEKLHKETIEMMRLLITGREYLVSDLRGEEVNADYEYNSELYEEKLVEVDSLLDEFIKNNS